MRCLRAYCAAIREGLCPFHQLFAPLIEFLALDQLDINFRATKTFRELTDIAVPQQRQDGDSLVATSPLFALDPQCHNFTVNYNKLMGSQLTGHLQTTQEECLNVVYDNLLRTVTCVSEQKPPERMVRCFLNGLVVDLFRGLTQNLDVLSLQHSQHDYSSRRSQLASTFLHYLRYMLEYESHESSILWLLDSAGVDQFVVSVGDKKALTRELLGSITRQQLPGLRQAMMKRVRAYAQSSVQVAEVLLANEGLAALNEVLQDEFAVAQHAVQAIVQLQKSDTSLQVFAIFPNLARLCVAEGATLRNLAFKAIPLDVGQFYQLFQQLLLAGVVGLGQLGAYVHFLLDDQKIAFEKQEMGDFLAVGPPAASDEREAWLVFCVQLLNHQDEELAQFAGYLADTFRELGNRHLLELANHAYLEEYIHQTEYAWVLRRPDTAAAAGLFQELLDRSQEAHLLQMLQNGPIGDRDALSGLVRGLRTTATTHVHVQIALAALLHLKRLGDFDYVNFESFISIVQQLEARLQLDPKTFGSDDRVGDVAAIVQVLVRFARAFPKYLRQSGYDGVVREVYRHLFISLYDLKYRMYEESDACGEDDRDRQSELLQLIQQIDSIQRNGIEQLLQAEGMQQFCCTLCCLDAPVLKKQFNQLLGKVELGGLYKFVVGIMAHLRRDVTNWNTRFLKYEDVMQDFVRLVQSFFRGKKDLEHKKEWVRLTLYCEEHGIHNLGKGLGKEGQEIVQSLLSSKKGEQADQEGL